MSKKTLPILLLTPVLGTAYYFCWLYIFSAAWEGPPTARVVLNILSFPFLLLSIGGPYIYISIIANSVVWGFFGALILTIPIKSNPIQSPDPNSAASSSQQIIKRKPTTSVLRLIAIGLVTLVAGIYFINYWLMPILLPQTEPRYAAPITGDTIEALSADWLTTDPYERHPLIERLLGSPAQRHHEYPLDETLLQGLNRDDIIQYLGTPEYDDDRVIVYPIGPIGESTNVDIIEIHLDSSGNIIRVQTSS